MSESKKETIYTEELEKALNRFFEKGEGTPGIIEVSDCDIKLEPPKKPKPGECSCDNSPFDLMNQEVGNENPNPIWGMNVGDEE